ncbi:MAG: FtsX-like permease family protein [Oscillospiraceae bacterium]|jgi:putative ABC transport system permease protein|nr:FtsX-like permease family protein [Oscillospiraceae bacterium]
MNKTLRKDILRTIGRSKARFISVIAIVALGIAFFAGMNVTPRDMLTTAGDYFEATNLMDISVVSTAGLTESDIYAIMVKNGRQLQSFMPVKFVDSLLYMGGQGLVDIDGSAFTCRAIGMDFDMVRTFEQNNPNFKDGVVEWDDVSYINRLTLLDGEWPDQPYECLVDDSALSTPEEFEIGKLITLKGDREDLSKSLSSTTFQIVGVVRTPTYINFERGNTNVGSGKLGTFIYVPQQSFIQSYYSQLYLKLKNTANKKSEKSDEGDFVVYSDSYKKYVDAVINPIAGMAEDRLDIRRRTLGNELGKKITDGQTALADKEKEVAQQLADAAAHLAQVEDAALNGDAQIAAKKAEFERELTAGQRQFYSGQSEYNAKLAEYNKAAAELAEAMQKLEENPNYKTDYLKAKQDLDAAKAKIDDGAKQIVSTEKMLNTLKGFFAKLDTNSSWEGMMAQLQAAGVSTSILDQFKKATAVGVAEEALGLAGPMIEDYEKELQTQKINLVRGQLEYNQKYAEWEAKASDIEGLDRLPSLQTKLNAEWQKLQAGLSEIEKGELTLTQKQTEGQYQLLLAQTQVAQAKAAYPTARATYEAEKAKAEAALEAAREELDAAQTTMNNLPKTRWMVTGREDLPGNTSYQQNAENVKILGTVFPLVFLAVAVLVVLATVQRMVEEERTQMGTLKALGYDETAIAWKYIFYALLAGSIGALIGLGIGFTVLPIAISAAFGIMFDMPPVELSMPWDLAVVGFLIALACSVGAALFACWKEMRTNPATLMRPKAPKAGKRVLLERIPFIWRRLGFTQKVTTRNLLRNKRRFVTTFIGIAGATALLLASFGLGDSVGAIIGYQYGEGGISRQDVQLVLRDAQNPDNPNEGVLAKLNAEKRLGDKVAVSMSVLNAGAAADGGMNLQEVNVLVPADAAQMHTIATLQDRKTGVPITLTQNGVVVTEMFADRAGISLGDEIIIKDVDGVLSRPVAVRGITENYTFSYIYMIRPVYEYAFNVRPEFNMVYAQLGAAIKSADEETRTSEKAALGADLMKIDGVSAVVYTTQVVENFNNIIGSLNYVILVFILAAAALAFVVLFNLSNLNVNERIREIATIKVLGFYDKEVSAYLYRENIILTLLGMAGGIVGGYFLHTLMAGVVRINVVMLGQSIEWSSYLFALLLTAGFAVIVNVMMHRRLKKVSMVESLKSVE